jgi:hypothetical protein
VLCEGLTERLKKRCKPALVSNEGRGGGNSNRWRRILSGGLRAFADDKNDPGQNGGGLVDSISQQDE